MKLKNTIVKILIGMTLMTGGIVMADVTVTQEKGVQQLNVTKEWDKTFKKSNKVDHQKVFFKNRYGITLVGDLYTPKNIGNKKLQAIAISGPFGAVKEQSSGLYAQTLAEKGFVTLAFDGSYTGESGGDVRNLASPEINTEDFSAAVDFLSIQNFVDKEKIGILGICGWGGMALNVAAIDTRIKAVATSTMYDMTKMMTTGYNFAPTSKEARQKTKEDLAKQRIEDIKNGDFAKNVPGLPENPDENVPQFIREYSNYYKTSRGFHKRSVNSNGSWTNTTPLSFMNFKLLSYANEINIPTLIVVGEKAHSKFFSDEAFEQVGSKNKELYVVKGATHTDLYDGGKNNYIPFDKFEKFFKENLK